MISQIFRFVKTDIWKIQLKNLSLIKVFFIKYFRVLALAIWGFKKDECPRRASALTYSSMLSTVPLIAVAFGIAKGFGFGNFIERQIIQMAGRGNWQGEVTDQILNFSRNLLEHTKGGVIAGVDMYERIGSGDLPATSSGEAEKISVFLKNISDEIEKSPKNVTVKEI